MTRIRTTTALLLMMAMLATACGARLSDEQRQAVLAGGSTGSGTASGGDFGDGNDGFDDGFGDGDGFDPGDPTSSGGDTGTDGGTSGDGATTGGDGGASTGGDSAGGGQSATGSQSSGGGGLPCAAKGASAPGVSDGAVRFGNVSQLSGVIQGFAKTAVGATQAYVAYRNSLRGICQRKVELEVADDRFDPGANRAEHNRLKGSVLAFVGSLSVVDDGGVAVLKGTDIPDVTLALSDAKLALENNWAPTPIDPADGGNNATGYARWLKDNEGITTYALIWPNQSTARNRAQGYVKDFERGGLKKGYTAEVAVTETNWTPHASAICGLGADKVILTTTLEVNGMAQLAKAIKQQGCLPKVSHYGAQAYGNQFISRAGDASEGVRIVISFDIVEGSEVPLTKEFDRWFRRVNPGVEPDFFAAQSWIAGHMLATAMEKIQGPITRAALIQQLDALKDWTADGMVAPITPGIKLGPRCFMIAKVSGGKWTRELPAKGFIC